MAAICSAICSRSSSRFCGFPGKKSPNSAMKRSNAGWVSWPASRISSIWLSALNMSFMRAMCSGLTSLIAPAIWLK